jgi:hypothetical protein
MTAGGKRPGSGRPVHTRMTLRSREKISKTIKVNQIIQRLHDFVDGTVKMEAAAVTAALGLLRKVMPDLAAVAHSGSVELKPASEMSDDRLASIASIGSDRTSETQDDTTKFH